MYVSNQIRVRKVGISQIGTVYQSVWAEFGYEVLYEFESMVFGDIRRNDRIARYYQLVL